MRSDFHTDKPNPRENASFISKAIFWWLVPLMLKGCKKPLEYEDLFLPQKQDKSNLLGDLVAKNWEKEIQKAQEKKRKPSYVRALIASFGLSYLFFGIFAFIEECLFKICAPVCLGYLIRHFSTQDEIGHSESTGYLLGLGIVLSTLFMLLTHHPYFFGAQSTGMQIRIASCSLIYRKALRLSTKALGKTTVGQLVNLLSNDVNRFDTSVIFLHYLWIGPMQSIISIIILWQAIGPSCLAGMSLIMFFVPLQAYMGKIFSKLRLKTAFRTDERIRIMNEMISAIRVIKMYAWETPFKKVIETARRLEIKIVMKANYFRAVNLTLFFTSAKVVIFLSLLVFVLTGNILNAEKVFLTSSLINNIRLTMTLFFPFAISMGSECLISCKRIQTFLEMEEKEECSRVNTSDLRPKPQNCYIECYDICARWDERSGEDNLHDISFFARAGDVMAIIGPVGSGKSSLLYTLLRELPIKEGQINVRGKIAYASQEPWLFSGTIRDNILFGQPYRSKRYNEVVRVCALERDMELFPDGDRTAVGERGVSLSGGQKARINLARAIYFDADIYLLDDPLSAVDAHVGKHLFEQCILEFLKHKVTIIATHQLQFLKNASNILYLKNGYVEAQGSYHQLKNTGVDFAGIKAVNEEEIAAESSPGEKNEHLVTKVTRLRRASEAWSLKHRGSINATDDIGFDTTSLRTASLLGGSVMTIDEDFYNDFVVNEKVGKKAGKETKATGSVKLKIYMKYFLCGGGILTFIFFVILNVVCQIFFAGSDYWLSHWSNNEQIYGKLISEQNNTNEKFDPIITRALNETSFHFSADDRGNYVSIYTGITVALLITSLMRTIMLFRICMTSSTNLHNRMFSAVIEVPMAFFEIHPIGQILNRFSKDTGQVDDLLPPALYDFLSIFLTIFGIVIMILYLNPWFLIPTAVICVLFIVVRWVYISSSRDIKRFEGMTRSPVFSHLSSTFQGLSTIRAFHAEEAVSVQFDDFQDTHTTTWHLFIAASRLFGITLDSLSLTFITVITFTYIIQSDALGGDVGLGISLAMMLSGMLQWGVRQSAEVESHMTSVERMIEYSKLEPEVPKETTLKPRKPDWPNKGNITFENVYLYYKEDETPVLKNLNFTIQSSEKVGIVGRTGAGKSSLLSCLFRLTPPQGDIIVDDVYTDTLYLQDLRKSISIIPQDPTLFTGSVRYNLDPFNDYSDEKLWTVLEEVELKNQVSDMNGNLEADISEGGANLSAGQRQLMCLARAILKHNKILVMDEATANVDPQTDSWIQDTIRKKFRDCTVLTIAHRLHTIMDSDRVMVLDAGKLEEFGPPHELLKKQGTIFSELVNQTGPATSQQLKDMAEEAYMKKYGKTITEFCIPEIHIEDIDTVANDEKNQGDESSTCKDKTDDKDKEKDKPEVGASSKDENNQLINDSSKTGECELTEEDKKCKRKLENEEKDCIKEGVKETEEQSLENSDPDVEITRL